MKTYTAHSELKDAIEAAKVDGKCIGFVPTMGALHDGHLSLIEVAKQHADFIVVSIFVNPTQFAPDEDFEQYPRNTERDVSLLFSIGVDAVYLPQVEEIYPDGAQVTIKAGQAAQGLETDFRTHFFDGVCTVVHRLFELAEPNIAVFGEKDYQQLMVIREMVETHSMGIEIVGAPTQRDKHGLALSSRNAYLSEEELVTARQLNQVLRSDKPTVEGLLQAGFDKVDYIEKRWGRILAAVWLGKTRLIDNIKLKG